MPRSFRENSVSTSSHFRESAGKLAAMFSHTRKSSQESHSDRDVFPQDIEQFEEMTKLYPDSLIRKKLRDWFFKNKEIIFSQTQNLKY